MPIIRTELHPDKEGNRLGQLCYTHLSEQLRAWYQANQPCRADVPASALCDLMTTYLIMCGATLEQVQELVASWYAANVLNLAEQDGSIRVNAPTVGSA